MEIIIFLERLSLFGLQLTCWQPVVSLFFMIVETECVFFLLVLPSSCFSGKPYFLLSFPNQTFLLTPPPPPNHHSSFHPSPPPFLPSWPTFSFALPPSFLFFCLPSLCGKSFWCVKCACMLTGRTHTLTHICCHSIMWPSSNQSESCLLDQPNICLCWLRQSEWWLMQDPVSPCCCYEFSLLPAWEEVCLSCQGRVLD